MWVLDHKEGYVPKNWCFKIVVLEKTLKSPLDCKQIKPAHPKGNQFWILIGRTDTEAETPILWPRDAKSQIIGKDPDAGKDWRWEEKGEAERIWFDNITNSIDMNVSGLQATVKDKEACRTAVHAVTKSLTWLSNWKITNKKTRDNSLEAEVN